MSSVVLRCPHCGTTRGSPGECDACHEENVRYYCTNHSPGRWLDAPTCSQCGARFGEAVRRPAAAAARPPAAARAPAPGPERGERPPGPRPGRTPAGAHETAGRERRWPGGGEGRPAPGHEPSPPAAPWDDLLRHAARSRREAADPRGLGLPPSRGPRLGGCLGRLLLLLMLVIFAAFSGLFLFAGSLFQMFRLY